MNGVPIPIIGAIKAVITPENGGYRVEIQEDDKTVYTKISKTAPWLSQQIIHEIANRSHQNLNPDSRPEPERYKKALSTAFTKLSTHLEKDTELKQSLSDPVVRQIIEQTEHVTIFPGEKTSLQVTLAGRKLSFSAREISMRDSTAFNERYFNEFFCPLDANRNEWKEIRDYWCQVAVIEEKHSETRMDMAIENLTDFLSDELVFYTDRDRVNGYETGYFNEQEGTMWVLSIAIERFIEKYDSRLQPGELGKELLARGITTKPAKKERYRNLPGILRNTWRFKPDFTRFRIDSEKPRTIMPNEGEGYVPVPPARE